MTAAVPLPSDSTGDVAPNPADEQAPKLLLSVVTVFWNGREDAGRFYTALGQAEKRLPFPVEAIAVDNASQDGTADLIAAEFPSVTLIRNNENLGFAEGCNQGLARSRGTHLLLLNPDCEPNAEALAAMVRVLRSHRTVGAVGCTLLHGDGLPQHSAHGEPGFFTYWGTHSLVSPLTLSVQKAWHRLAGGRRRPRRTAWLMGACLMVPRRVYKRVGGLDPEYFMYSEDADWCRRIRDAGFVALHAPQWTIVHHHGTSARRRPEFAFLRLYRSMLLYTRKHQPGMQGRLTRAAVIGDMALRLPIYALGGNRARLRSAREVLRMYWRNDPDAADRWHQTDP